MDRKALDGTVIRTGICRYGFRRYRVFLCKNDFRPGSGDYEDEPEIRDNKAGECYSLWVEDMLAKDTISAGGGYYKTLHEAVCAAEQSGGFESWLR